MASLVHRSRSGTDQDTAERAIDGDNPIAHAETRAFGRTVGREADDDPRYASLIRMLVPA
ncbi:MAG: hypothetical protein CME05_11620 [Gemmatimonadaceae bacterium]|nr:hypothetical protein [Gemmatimonadaceae bacterium]